MKRRDIFLILIFAAALLRTLLLALLFSCRIIRERQPVAEITGSRLKAVTDNHTRENTIEEIIQGAGKQQLPAGHLLLKNASVKSTHQPYRKRSIALGYAAFLAAVIRYGLWQQGVADQWEVRHQIGNVYFLGNNVNRYVIQHFSRPMIL